MSSDIRQRLKSLLSRKLVLAANAGLLLLVIWGFAGEFRHNRVLAEEIDRLEQQAQGLEGKNLELARLSEQLASGALVEREARLTLGLQKEGESVVVIHDDGAARIAVPVAPPSPGSNAAKWWTYFFHGGQQ